MHLIVYHSVLHDEIFFLTMVVLWYTFTMLLGYHLNTIIYIYYYSIFLFVCYCTMAPPPQYFLSDEENQVYYGFIIIKKFDQVHIHSINNPISNLNVMYNNYNISEDKSEFIYSSCQR